MVCCSWFFVAVIVWSSIVTQPHCAGARLTAFELVHDGIPATLVCDSATCYLMSSGQVDAVVVGADRVVANGDTANKIGT